MVEGWSPKGVWGEWVAVGGRGISEDQTWYDLTCQEIQTREDETGSRSHGRNIARIPIEK